jgi:hypothetical protein
VLLGCCCVKRCPDGRTEAADGAHDLDDRAEVVKEERAGGRDGYERESC